MSKVYYVIPFVKLAWIVHQKVMVLGNYSNNRCLFSEMTSRLRTCYVLETLGKKFVKKGGKIQHFYVLWFGLLKKLFAINNSCHLFPLPSEVFMKLEGTKEEFIFESRKDASPSNDLSLTKSPHHGVHPVAALTTRSTLSTRFMLVKKSQPCNGLDNIALLVHNDYGSSSKTSLSCYQCIKVHKNIVANPVNKKRIWMASIKNIESLHN